MPSGHNISRTEVYAALASGLNEISNFPTPYDFLSTLPHGMGERGFRNALEGVREGYEQLCELAELRFCLDRLCKAFSPDSLQMRAGAEWILSNYPPSPGRFSSLETLRQDDGNRVSSAIGDNNAQIDLIRHMISCKLRVAWADLDQMARSVLIDEMESLGIQWGIYEARIQSVRLWFRDRWGADGAHF